MDMQESMMMMMMMLTDNCGSVTIEEVVICRVTLLH
jgi:hypothetical protein